jgi:hypothetical protein
MDGLSLRTPPFSPSPAIFGVSEILRSPYGGRWNPEASSAELAALTND